MNIKVLDLSFCGFLSSEQHILLKMCKINVHPILQNLSFNLFYKLHLIKYFYCLKHFYYNR